jgi:hypothetical protein
MKKNMLKNLGNSIEKNLDRIQLNFRLKNIPPKNTGEFYVSGEYLESIMGADVEAGESVYMYDFSHLSITDKLYMYAQEMFPDLTPVVSGSFLYPPGGFMSWHTNSDKPNKHLYFTYADKHKKSFFRSFVNGNIITDYDNKGLNIRVFDTVNVDPLLWHCVYSDCNRYSFGFRLLDKDEPYNGG